MLALASIFVGCWLVVPSAYQLANQQFAWGDYQVATDSWRVTQALILTFAAQAALLIGYKWRRLNRDTPHGPGTPNYMLWGTVFALLSIALLPFVIRAVGGLGNLFALRDQQTALAYAADSGGVMSALVDFLPYSLALVGALYLIAGLRAGRKRSITAWVLLAIALIGVWLYANPIANTRFVALASFGALALAAFWPRSRRAGTLVSVGFVGVTLLIYPLIRLISTSLSPDALATDSWGQLGTGDFDGFQQTVNAIQFVQDQGNTWGHYLLSAALIFVPRSIWADKAIPASLDVAANRGYSFTNLSLPTSAEIYVEFGWLGVVVIFALVGILWARLDSRWSTRIDLQPLISLLALGQIGIIRGPLGSQLPVLLFALIACAVPLVLARRRD